MLVDDGVELRLSHGRVIGLVVTAQAVDHEINEDVLAKLAAVLGCHLTNPDNCLWVIAVDVEDRAVEALGQVGGVMGGATGVRGGGEAHLVVDHDVDGAAVGITAQLGQVDGLLNNAQAGEGSITVEHDRNNGVAFWALVQDVLLSAGDALHDRIDGLEVGWVGSEGDLDFAIAKHLQVVALGAQVVLHVTGAAELAALVVAVELAEDIGQWLAHDIEQDVQAAAVRHADDDLVQILAGGGIDDGIQQRNEGFGALEGEALLAHVLGLQEVLECFGGIDLLQDVLLLRVGRLRHTRLQAVLQPAAFIAVQDVGVFGADLQGVGGAQARQHLAQGHLLLAAKATDVEGAVQIPNGQAVGRDVEVAVVRVRQSRLYPAQRVGIGQQVAAGAVGLDELHDAGVLVHAGVRHVLCPTERLIRHAHGGEEVVPKGAVDKQLANGAQELAGLCTLDDAVVIGGGQGNQAADAQVRQAVRGSAGKLGRVIHGAHADNGAGALSQAGDGVAGADSAWVGEVNGHTREVIHGELVLARTGNDVLVGLNELGERLGLALLDGGDDQRTGAILLRQVNCQA